MTTHLIQRSSVAPEKNYRNFRQALRIDFWFSCAYCTITELESAGVGFCIDHYEPQVRAPSLTNTYSNLMWCCDLCNGHKGELPIPEHVAQGFRFICIDKDNYFDHLAPNGLLLAPKTKIGKYTHSMLYLDAAHLRRVRELRSRMTASTSAIAAGLRYLSNVPFDHLPPSVRSRFALLRQKIQNKAEKEKRILAEALKEMSRSYNLDMDPRQADHAAARRKLLDTLGSISSPPSTNTI